MGTTHLGGLHLAEGLRVTKKVTLDTPLAKENIADGVKREIRDLLFSGTLADSTTYQRVIAVRRPGKIKGASIAAWAKNADSTAVFTLEKVNGGTTKNLLSTANIDLSSLTAIKVAQALGLTTTTADLDVVAGDIIVAKVVVGTPTVNPEDVAVAIELEYD